MTTTVPAAAPAAEPPGTAITTDLLDLPGQVHAISISFYHWLRTDSRTAAIAIAAMLLLFALLYGIRWSAKRLLGPGHRVTSWRGFTRRMVAQTYPLFLGILAIRIVTRIIAPPEVLVDAIRISFTVAAVLQVAAWVRTFILGLIERHGNASEEDAAAVASAMGVITLLVNVVVWVLALILVLDNLGVNVTALVAGLGVGGIAIGLAAQGVFSDLFAALSILFDRPFRVGDTISFGTTTGTVEAIGLKTTRIRALSGEQIIVSNKNLLDMQIANLRRIEARRVLLTLNLALDTPTDKLAKVQAMAEAAVAGRDHCHFERAHLWRATLDSIEAEIVFHTDVPDADTFMNARQAVLIDLIGRFRAEGILLAERLPAVAEAK